MKQEKSWKKKKKIDKVVILKICNQTYSYISIPAFLGNTKITMK